MSEESAPKKNSTTEIKAEAPWRLKKFTLLPDYQIEVIFMDGLTGIVSMKGLIQSDHAGVFAALRDKTIFEQAALSYGVLTWPGEIDLAPDAMHDAIHKKGEWIL